jgi:hypothetical protein
MISWDEQQRRKEAAIELDFIEAEIALGLTFLDVADTTSVPETRIRNRCKAQKAHDAAAGRMTHYSYETKKERESIEALLLVLTKRLAASA